MHKQTPTRRRLEARNMKVYKSSILEIDLLDHDYHTSEKDEEGVTVLHWALRLVDEPQPFPMSPGSQSPLGLEPRPPIP